jgi:hypothetical protein
MVKVASLKLTETAKLFYNTTPSLRVSDVTWAAFKAALKERFRDPRNEQYHYMQLHRARQNVWESCQDFADRVRGLDHRINPTSQAPGALDSHAEHVKHLTLTAYMNGLIGNPGMQVGFRAPETMEEAIQVATILEQAEQRAKKGETFYLVGESNNTRRVPTTDREDRNRKPRAGDMEGAQDVSEKADIICFECGGHVHMARRCATRLDRQKSGTPPAHQRKTSPQPRRKGRPKDDSRGRENAPTWEAGERRDQGRDVDRTFLLGPANTVGEITTWLRVVKGAPTIRVEVDRVQRNFIVDTGSSISLIQPDVSASVIQDVDVAPIGVTGTQLRLEGEQWVEFRFHDCVFRYPFHVCSLPTDADGLVGTDLLIHLKARLDLNNLTFAVRKPIDNVGDCRSKRSAHPVVFTVFAAQEGPPKSVAETNGRRQDAGRQGAVMRLRPDRITFRESDARAVTRTETLRLAPRTKQVVKGQMDPPGTKLRHAAALSLNFQTAETDKALSNNVIRREQGTELSCETRRVKPDGARSKKYCD